MRSACSQALADLRPIADLLHLDSTLLFASLANLSKVMRSLAIQLKELEPELEVCRAAVNEKYYL